MDGAARREVGRDEVRVLFKTSVSHPSCQSRCSMVSSADCLVVLSLGAVRIRLCAIWVRCGLVSILPQSDVNWQAVRMGLKERKDV